MPRKDRVLKYGPVGTPIVVPCRSCGAPIEQLVRKGSATYVCSAKCRRDLKNEYEKRYKEYHGRH